MPTQVLVPPLGQTVDTLTFVSWYKQEGEAVRQGEPLFAVETDKATLDVEAPASGVLRNVTAWPGDELAALSAIALIAAVDEIAEMGAQGNSGELVHLVDASEWKDVSEDRASSQEFPGVPTSPPPRPLASPRARRLAEQVGVALAEVMGTGPGGAIVERDVRAFVQNSDVRGSEVGESVFDAIPLRGMRALIAERMAQSHRKTAPVTLTAEADATELVELRQRLRGQDVVVSYNDLLIAILARALREHPRLNASLEGDAIKLWRRIDIGLAVDTDRGLLAPVVRNVGQKGLAQLAAETRDLVERSRSGKILPDELRGATFTLTNLGMFGVDAFTPIINLPETAILGVGRIREKPAMVGGQVVGRQMVWLSLTFDHRLVDGGLAARFLQRVVQLVEQPVLLLL